MDLQAVFDRSKADEGKKLIDGAITLTYGALYERCAQITGFLNANDFKPGDSIGIATTDEVELSALFLCGIQQGLRVAFIDPAAKKAEATHIIDRLKPKALFMDQDLVESWNPVGSAIWTVKKQKSKLITRLLGKKDDSTPVTKTYPECLQQVAQTSESLPLAHRTDHAAMLLCTSGTTGLPKILQLNLTNLLSATQTTSTQLRFNASMRMLNLLPLTHYDGSISGLFSVFYNSATLVRLAPFTISSLPDIFDAIYQYRITHLLLTPAILGLMLRLGVDEIQQAFAGEDFQFVISVAATLPPKLWAEFQAITGKKVVNVYGLSETGNNLFAGPDEESYSIGSIGKPIDCRAAIIDEDGQPVAPGETGELLLKADSIVSSYLEEPLPTKVVGEEQWFPTGDLAYRDQSGIYWLVGRKKNIIIVGGRNVYPDEINNVLRSHSAVTEAATLGLPDEIWGERIVSCVVAKDGISSSDLLDYAAKSLTDYKVPREIHLFTELPKGRSGKVLLTELAGQLQDKSNQKSHVVDLEKSVVRLASESFRMNPSELSLKTAPANCSRWDSVAHMDFVTNLELNFGVELLPREVIQITSIDAAVRMIRSKLV